MTEPEDVEPEELDVLFYRVKLPNLKEGITEIKGETS